MNFEIVEREVARANGLKRYFTGQTCSRGHLDQRWVSSRNCVSCTQIHGRITEAKATIKSRRQAYAEANQEQRRATAATWRANNKERHRIMIRDWRDRNPDRLKVHRARRRAAELQAIPMWMTPEMLIEIDRIYKDCPKGHEVDHEIPLRGRLVCGLHIPINLRYLTIGANRAKGNSFTPG